MVENKVEKWSVSTSGAIPIRCGCDLQNKHSFTKNEF